MPLSRSCNSYHTRKRNKYLDPATVAHLTGKWPENNGVIEEEYGVCWGTKEQDECSCGGDKCKCDFYDYSVPTGDKDATKEKGFQDLLQPRTYYIPYVDLVSIHKHNI